MNKLPYIRQSKKFYGKFEVVVTSDLTIPCYNLASARSIVTFYTEEFDKKNNSKRKHKIFPKQV